MTSGTADFGFWRSLFSFGFGQVVRGSDFVAAVALSSGMFFLSSHDHTTADLRLGVTISLAEISAALLGVILAGFAIVAALLGDRYTRLVEASGASILQMLRHFLVVGGLLVASIVGSLAYRFFADALGDWEIVIEHLSFSGVLFLFLWSLFGVVELMKLILGVAVTSQA